MQNKRIVDNLDGKLSTEFNNSLFQEITAIHRNQSDLFPPESLKRLLNALNVRPLEPGEIYDWNKEEQPKSDGKEGNKRHWYLVSFCLVTPHGNEMLSVTQGLPKKGMTARAMDAQIRRAYPRHDPKLIVPLSVSYLGYFSKEDFHTNG